jgi:predicted MFS family arabinose efflux permease
VRLLFVRQLPRGGAAGARQQERIQHGKGTALGVYASCQFLGAFAGGTSGGLVYGAAGLSGLLWLCLGAIGLWLLLIWQLPQRDAVPAPA